MAERNVKVKLSAEVQGYIQSMKDAAQATRDTGTESEKMAQKARSFELVGKAALLMGAGITTGLGMAVSKFADFDQAMSNVQAATHESAGNMDLLRDAALDAGARTVFSATEAANAIEELSKAGVATADILSGGLDGALDLAAAGGLGVADAAGIAATALKTFNLEGSDMAHVADLLAAGAGKAMGDVTDLSQALNQSAMVANATGLSIEETTAGLAAFASQGLLGSDAGTSFKSMLQSLTPSSKEAERVMKELGISAYDSGGNFIGLAEFAGNLQGALKDLTVEQQQAALKTIFGSDAIRAATVLYTEGEKGIRGWEEAVADSGYAADTAAARMDNLKGDLEALGGALETALIETGSSANDVMREVVQTVAGMIDAYASLPKEWQGATMLLGTVTAAVATLGGAFMLGVPKFAEYKAALADLPPVATRVHKSLVEIGKGLSVVAGGLAAVQVLDRIASSGRDASVGLEQLEKMVRAGGIDGAFDGLSDEANTLNKSLELLLGDSLNSNMERFGSTLNRAVAGGTLTDQVQEAEARFESLGETLAGLVSEGKAGEAAARFEEIADAAKALGFETDEVSDLMPAYEEALADVDNANADAAASGEDNSDAIAGVGDSAADAAEQLQALRDEIAGFAEASFDSRSANRDLEQSLADLQQRLAENGLNFDIATEAGRQNEAALDAVAQGANEAAAAVLIQTGSQEAANAKLEEGRQKLIDILTPYYGSRDAAAAYVNQLNLISPQKVTEIVANTENASAKILTYKQQLDNIPKILTTEARAQITMEMFKNWSESSNANGGLYAYENGGIHENVQAMHAFAAGGGVDTGIYKGGTPIIKFAEQETGWEAFISGKPSQRDRNRQIWQETGERLGMNGGGQREVVHVPTHVTVVDADNRIVGTMRVVANKEIDDYSSQREQARRRAQF
ncbi:phage tail tape measure protein [Leucobacter chromiiresistens]